MTNKNRISLIERKLTASLQPSQLEIIDESHLHIGHPGAKDGRGHFAVKISSPAFTNKTSIECHRLIYQALGKLMETDIHALRIIRI